ncbi:hypothetical protein DYB28_003006 [Aphanomyces astaci]|uniref:Uncharacterized protein n=1 Tax=Aphanomyces astaci TaxID=112090 RepID=A0A9X8DY24_APHAT|nr:hypothetical protein DYB28_003006 [Aphanomyces astaci]
MAHGLDTFLDDDLGSSSLMFNARSNSGTDGGVSDATAVHKWDVASNLCISIDRESSPGLSPCDSIIDLPSPCLTAPVERKRKGTLETALSNGAHPRAEKRMRVLTDADMAAPSTAVQFTGVHNENTRFTFTAFGSTARTLGAPCSFASSTPFHMTRSSFVSSVPSSSTSPSCMSANVPATPRLRCFD